jgi:hypothetical protein
MLAAPVAYPCMAPRLQQQQHLQQHARRGAAAVTKAGPPEQHSCNDSKKKLAVFVSGGGSNFKAIHAACLKGQINAEVVVSHSRCHHGLYMCSVSGRIASAFHICCTNTAATPVLLLLSCKPYALHTPHPSIYRQL